jgi:hypothetical protein
MDTNLGDLDLNPVSIFVDPHDVYIIKRIVRRLRVTPSVLTCQ